MLPEDIARGRKHNRHGGTPITADLSSHEVDTWIREACRTIGCLDVIPKVQWEFSDDPRFVRQWHGYCQCCWDNDGHLTRAHIYLSPTYWKRAPVHKRKAVVMHEICHAMAVAVFGAHRAGLEDGGLGHNNYWGHLMRQCGQEPTAVLTG